MSLTLRQIRGALARGYCSDENRHKPVDVTLLDAMATEVMIEIDHALSIALQQQEREHGYANADTLQTQKREHGYRSAGES
jgi:hypothetical protein